MARCVLAFVEILTGNYGTPALRTSRVSALDEVDVPRVSSYARPLALRVTLPGEIEQARTDAERAIELLAAPAEPFRARVGVARARVGARPGRTRGEPCGPSTTTSSC